AWLGMVTYLGAFLGEEVGFDTRQIGVVYMLSGVGYVLGSVAAGGRVRGIPPRTVVAVASVATGVLLGSMLLLAESWVVLPLLIAGSFASAAVGVGATALLAAESPAGAGTTMVLNGSILNLGTALSTALGGALIAFGGYTALGIGLPIFAFAAALLALWPGDREEGSKSPTPSALEVGNRTSHIGATPASPESPSP
ncbi:MAG: MFS transporter, partial [Chloroflexia bacterium]|nr:MFS transporter [Chloroflexia bacterium]